MSSPKLLGQKIVIGSNLSCSRVFLLSIFY